LLDSLLKECRYCVLDVWVMSFREVEDVLLA